MSCEKIINLTGYKFTNLEDLLQIKALLLNLCKKNQIKGTILVAPEGININISGTEHNTATLLKNFSEISWLKDITYKRTISDYIPFNRMLVRLKKEIISFGQDGIDPLTQPTNYIEPEELKQWYDEQKEFIILDTRNSFEVRIGTFKNAINPEIKSFKRFIEKSKDLPPKAHELPIVTFCTGGVRCEKAAPFLEKNGFKNVYQLNGGILNYFQKVGGDHYEGDCFVFDQRTALNPECKPNGMIQCHCCREPLSIEEQASPLYQESISCPNCIDQKAG
jgi:predicted sulfurtransferase